MGCFVRGDKNYMGCFVRGGKLMQDVLSGVSKNDMGCFVTRLTGIRVEISKFLQNFCDYFLFGCSKELNMCFRSSKERSYWEGSLKYP